MLGVDAGYVLDRMEMYEVRALLKHQHMKHRESWEQTRMGAFVAARCSGSKVSDVKKVFGLPWDGDSLDTAPATEEEEKRLQAMARSIIASGALLN